MKTKKEIDKLFKKYEKYVPHILNKFINKGLCNHKEHALDYEDLLQEGRIFLLEAINKYSMFNSTFIYRHIYNHFGCLARRLNKSQSYPSYKDDDGKWVHIKKPFVNEQMRYKIKHNNKKVDILKIKNHKIRKGNFKRKKINTLSNNDLASIFNDRVNMNGKYYNYTKEDAMSVLFLLMSRKNYII